MSSVSSKLSVSLWPGLLPSADPICGKKLAESSNASGAGVTGLEGTPAPEEEVTVTDVTVWGFAG